MTILLIVLAVLGVLPLVAVALAHHWANTPHGRLKPIVAFGLRMQGIFDKESIESVLVRPMETPEQRDAVRAKFLADVAPMSKPVDFDGSVEDRTVDGPGGEIPVRVYTPAGAGPFRLVLYMHGGGFIVGSPDYTEAVTREIAKATPAVVVSVDYRLSPEAPWPAAIEDCERVLEWCIAQAEELKIRTDAIAIGGDSAGGNLSAILAQRDRDSGRGSVGLQVLIYPAVDATRTDRASQIAFARGYGLSRKDIEGCFDLYVQGKAERSDPMISPLFTSSFEGLAPALIFTAGFDVLRDEGVEYAEKLAAAGVAVEHVHEPEMPHGYITMTRVLGEASDSIARIVSSLRQL